MFAFNILTCLTLMVNNVLFQKLHEKIDEKDEKLLMLGKELTKNDKTIHHLIEKIKEKNNKIKKQRKMFEELAIKVLGENLNLF